MKKGISFAMLLALIVAQGAVANAATDTTVNLFPIAFGTFAGHDTYLAVTSLSGPSFANPGNPIVITSIPQSGTAVIGVSDLAEGTTRVYASSSLVDPRNFGCTNDICTVVICAPAVDALQPNVEDLPVVASTILASSLFWLNNGQFYAITTPIVFANTGCPFAPANGTPIP